MREREKLVLYFYWITMTRKFSKHLHATYRTLKSCFDLTRSQQHCIPWSPPLEIEPTTTECRSRNSTTGPPVHITVVEFRLHSVIVGLISSGGDHGMHCWWDLKRSKQLFSVPYVACRCLPNFLVIVIYIYNPALAFFRPGVKMLD